MAVEEEKIVINELSDKIKLNRTIYY